jgi:NAD(P) transhydrogenase subunit alpha
VQSGAGLKAGVPDAEYEAAGASIAPDAKAAADGADIVLKVRRPAEDELPALKRGAIVVAIMDPYGHEAEVKAMADAGVSAIAMELMPRITRAQVMDVLSSQANLAGSRAVVDGVAVEDDEFKQAETAGGYAKEMSAEYKKKQAELVASHIAKQDIVVTTALIPGRPAPKLVTADMVSAMRPGSVLVDLAVERGGNVEGVKADEVVETENGVKIVGYANVPGRLAATSSSLYARNLYAFVETLVDKGSKALAVKWDDELVKATCLTRDGAVVHPNFQPKAA